jgi:glycine oxidase
VTIVVVGGGVIGCAVAYELASRGARVQVFDARGVGQGATRASAGMLAPYIEGHSNALRTLGACSLEQYDAFLSRVAADAQRPVEYRRTGTLQVGCGQQQAVALSRAAERMGRARISYSLLRAGEVRRLEPALGSAVTAGVLVPQHGYVGVDAFVTALEAAAIRGGVTFAAESVERIEPGSHGLEVRTAAATLTADAVVLAAGSWSGQLPMTPALPPPVRPIRGQLLHVAFPAPPLSRVVWGARAYLVPWLDGTMLIGATSEDVGFDESATVEGVRRLLEAAGELLPGVYGARFLGVRVGLRPGTSDELPIIGPSSTMPGVYYATGHYRNGVLLAPLTALMLADLILEGRERAELSLVRPSRFGL